MEYKLNLMAPFHEGFLISDARIVHSGNRTAVGYYKTSVAMTRPVLSGLFKKYSNGNEFGHRDVRETIRIIEEMNISESDKKRVMEDNAKKLLHLPI